MSTMPESESKSYDDFIGDVWAFESSIDPAKEDYYNDNWNHGIESYPKVEYPGRVVRDMETGKPIELHNLTIAEYFKSIGIGHLYDPTDPKHNWRQIQASVTNYLGFVGFQFQESDLQDLGYYNFETITVNSKVYPKHYVDVPVSHWKNGVTGFLNTNPKEVSAPTWVTDTVHFVDANFTGKNNISSVCDFINPDKQAFIIRNHFENKYAGILSGLAKRGKSLSDYLGTMVAWDSLNPPVSPPPSPPDNRSNEVLITMSGLLAGAHLRGAQGVVSLLVDHQNPADENQTYILQYVQDFAGYQTPFTSRKEDSSGA